MFPPFPKGYLKVSCSFPGGVFKVTQVDQTARDCFGTQEKLRMDSWKLYFYAGDFDVGPFLQFAPMAWWLPRS